MGKLDQVQTTEWIRQSARPARLDWGSDNLRSLIGHRSHHHVRGFFDLFLSDAVTARRSPLGPGRSGSQG